jgi:serine/threonine protein kinase
MEIAVKKLPSKEKEASILAMLDHPNIIEFYGACEQPGNYSILIEFARYGSLYSFLQTKEAAKLDFEQMIRWALDIARGVNYLHNEAPCKGIS